MTAKAIRDLLHGTPFKPFTVYVLEQTPMHVPHPDFAMLSGDRRLLVVTDEDGGIKLIDLESISSLATETADADAPA
jgi:hypothetical protein